MAVNHVQALDSYPMDGWRSSRTHPLAKRETLTGPQVRILHHPLHGPMDPPRAPNPRGHGGPPHVEVPVPLSGEPGECAMFDAETFERLLDRAAIVFRKVFDDECQE